MPKYERLLEILDEIFLSGQKVVIFTSYNEMTDILTGDLPARFAGCYVDYIDGRVPVPRRQPAIDAFSTYQGPAALVLNPKAAGVGLNITAANHVIHYNPEWNPAVEDQASARVHRRRQTLPVTVHHLYFVGSVEEVMIDRLQLKRDIAREVVVGHEGDAEAADIARALRISPLNTGKFGE
jgi:SNF2 family DNA or RNA helicase